ncbi:hypothetical protein ZWY2020_028072 [Hordeum vulgare]|nr:hypothetical protein ZWY2020_028072 [Hordeum vulgare]
MDLASADPAVPISCPPTAPGRGHAADRRVPRRSTPLGAGSTAQEPDPAGTPGAAREERAWVDPTATQDGQATDRGALRRRAGWSLGRPGEPADHRGKARPGRS